VEHDKEAATDEMNNMQKLVDEQDEERRKQELIDEENAA